MKTISVIPEALLLLLDRIQSEGRCETPLILTSKALLEYNYHSFCSLLPVDAVFFPVKSNNAPEVLACLRDQGARFEAASAVELYLLLSTGIASSDVIFSNPIKSPEHIAQAHQAGVRTFAIDAASEVRKIQRYAPQSDVYVRIEVSNEGAEWKLHHKFGAPGNEVVGLCAAAIDAGLVPVGLAFHVGWNNGRLESWSGALQHSVQIAKSCIRQGIPLRSINIGGGFPAHGGDQYARLKDIADVLRPTLQILKEELGLLLYAEPGSFIAANACVMVCRVLDVVQRRDQIWVYVDSGINQGFYWIYAGIRYQVVAAQPRSHRTRNYVVTGPTCDSQDIFGEAVELPADLREGDILLVFPAGAYVSSARNYNGFAYPSVLFE
jgi:ornithine decarboxylase